MDPKSNLLQVVLALDRSRRFSNSLHSGQQQANQDRDDRDHNQQFDERKGGRMLATHDKPFHN